MMTQQLEVSILAAPLAAIDRRALSQAWFSALHLASEGRRTAAMRESAPSAAATLAGAKPQQETDARCLRAAEARVRHFVQVKRLQITAQPSAARISANRCTEPLSQRIERHFAHSTSQVKRATFSMGRGAARVHVILQTSGNVATLVALCRPQMRGVVARALAHARFGLATRGFVLDLEMRGERCS